ncbi:hypothetical protein ACU8KH_04922 [Lachancea thermotolerans]
MTRNHSRKLSGTKLNYTKKHLMQLIGVTTLRSNYTHLSSVASQRQRLLTRFVGVGCLIPFIM